MADKYEQTTAPTQAMKSEIVFPQSSAYRWPSLLNTTEARATDSDMKVHFVAAEVLIRKIMPIFTPVESQVQATSHLAILKGHWKDVANICLALNELL